MFILYDAFSLSKIQRIYSTYKKKLCVLIKFVMKYDYMCKHFYNMTIIYIDHRLLTRFLKSDFHEEIYEHWTNQLKRLNIDIKYISKFRNKMTNELFRTIFSKNECLFSENIKNALKKVQKDRAWVWKNDKKRYEKFLTFLSWNQKSKIIQEDFLKDAAVFTTTIDVMKNEQNSWRNSYFHSKWFKDYYVYLKSENLFENDSKVLRKTFDHRIDMKIDFLWICHKNAFLSCISKRKIVSVLKKIHDNSKHWNKAIILIKLRNMIYWSDQSEDVESYIEKCIQCARYESTTKSQSLHSIQMIQSFDLIIMNFINSFKKTVKKRNISFISWIIFRDFQFRQLLRSLMRRIFYFFLFLH